jgi:hypothetical protein
MIISGINNMNTNRFKQIYINLNDGKWYISDQTSDSNLKSLRVIVNTISDSWYVEHNRNTKKIYFQIVDNTNSEIIPKSIKFIDLNSIQIDFSQEISGTLHLVFTKNEFYNI